MDTCELDRNLAHFKHDLWRNVFSSFSLDMELLESYTKEVEKLKEEVKEELVAVGVEVSEKMNLINILERLGVNYLFTKEIEEQLDQIYTNYEEMNIDCDLCTTAVHFRIFRQHGYNVSCDVFNKFKDNSGTFKESLKNDLNGILSLYEATYLMVNGEDVLDHAREFTKPYLEAVAPSLSPVMTKQVKHALEQSLHRSVPRIEAKSYIPVIEQDSSRNDKILRLAKVDFNRLQLLHREELHQVLRWWKNLKLESKYARERIVEAFLWGSIIRFEPEYSLVRILVAKFVYWLTIVDDSYDAYGTHDELSAFTQAIQRWDFQAVDQLPKYLKPLFREIFICFDELEKELEKKGTSYALHYLKEAIKDQVRSYGEETEWIKKRYVPSFDEYMACRIKSCSRPIIIVAFIGLGEVVTPQAFEWMSTNNQMITASDTICRITNDIVGHKFEQQREHVPSAVECYMKQHNVTEQEAIDELNKMVEKEWFRINEEMLRNTSICKNLLMTIVNSTRSYTEFYKTCDGYTEPEALKDHVKSLFVDPIPL